MHQYTIYIPPSENITCLPYSLTRDLRNDSAISIFLCLEILISRILLCIGSSTATHNHASLAPI